MRALDLLRRLLPTIAAMEPEKLMILPIVVVLWWSLIAAVGSLILGIPIAEPVD